MVLINKNTFDIFTRIVGEKYNKDDYFECDELLAPTIYNLNSKGYITKNCCSGHIYPEKQKRADGGISYIYDNLYIDFDKKYEFDKDIFPSFAWMDGTTLRADIETMTDIFEERRDIILRYCDEIWKWSVKLPNINNQKDKASKGMILKILERYIDFCQENNLIPSKDEALKMYLDSQIQNNSRVFTRLFDEAEIIKKYIGIKVTESSNK